MGSAETAVNVSESDGMVNLTVAISMPPEDVLIETSFSLLINTATGLLEVECKFGLFREFAQSQDSVAHSQNPKIAF